MDGLDVYTIEVASRPEAASCQFPWTSLQLAVKGKRSSGLRERRGRGGTEVRSGSRLADRSGAWCRGRC